jgi:hypothetical protein
VITVSNWLVIIVIAASMVVGYLWLYTQIRFHAVDTKFETVDRRFTYRSDLLSDTLNDRIKSLERELQSLRKELYSASRR